MNVTGKIIAPPSKSYEQRLLVGALLSNKKCIIKNAGQSKDVFTARDIISTIGAKIDKVKDDEIIVYSGFNKDFKTLFCGESGLCARMYPVIAMLFKDEFVVNGEGSLLKRPVAKAYSSLLDKDVVIKSKNNYLPVEFYKCKLKAGEYFVDGSDTSQFISGLLMALPVLDSDSYVFAKNCVSINYILLTLNVLKQFGVSVEYKLNNNKNFEFFIKGSQSYHLGTYIVEGDWSSVSIFMVLAAIAGNIKIQGLNKNSCQADKAVLDVFDKININYFWEGEELIVKQSKISSFVFDATNCPDLIPSLVVLSAFADGISKIKGCNRLQTKESNRAEVLKKELSKAGIQIEFDNDYIIVYPFKKIISAILNANNDHRMAMAFSVFEILFPDKIRVLDKNCVMKSYPNYFNDLAKLKYKP